MKYVTVIAVVVLALSAVPLFAQEEERHIWIDPGRFIQPPRFFEEPIPLDRTLRLVFKLSSGEEQLKELTLLCATTIYSAEAEQASEEGGDSFSIGGTLRMVRNTEVLVTFEFETEQGELEFGGNGSVKIDLGDEKTVFRYGGYTVSVRVELEED